MNDEYECPPGFDLAGGLIFGPLFGGLIYQKYSMTAVYSFCAIVVMLGVLLQVGLYFFLSGQSFDRK